MLKKILIEAVKAGSLEVQRFFNSDFKISYKEGINNPVTEADHAAEKAIIQVIRNYFPDHFILSEEAGEIIQESSFKWIIDPIDGTINFSKGIPLNCVSIGIEHNGEMLMGAVYNPHLNELFFAEKGKGSVLNEKKIVISEESNILKSCLVTGFPYTYLNSENGPLDVFTRLIKKGVPVRRLGSAAIDLCWVACSRFDGFYEHKLEPWDSAAGFLLVEEAGGKVTDLYGNKFSPYKHGIVATNGKIHDKLIAIIQGNYEF